MAEAPTLRSAELRGVIVDASDHAHDLRGLLAVIPTEEPREWRWRLLLGVFSAQKQNPISSRPPAELVRRICNTAEALGRSCGDVARLSGHVELGSHGETLIADADAVWADRKHPTELSPTLSAVTGILQRLHVDVARGRL